MTRDMVVSTIIPHKNIHKKMLVLPGGRTRNQMDHVVIGGRIKISIMDVPT